MCFKNETGNLQQDDISGCPYVIAQLVIIKELERIAKLPTTKTFKGALIRVGNCRKLILELKELELIKKGYKVKPNFETGGVVNGVSADKIFIDGNEYIIPTEYEDPQ